MKIGISIKNNSKLTEKEGIYNSGIKQNIIFIYELLEKQGYDVYFISNNNIVNSKYKYISINDKNELYKLNFYIEIGLILSNELILEMKKQNIYCILFFLGNDFIYQTKIWRFV